MEGFLDLWADSAGTSPGLFWMAFWAFGLGYLISAMIQVFVTRERMRAALGTPGPRSLGLATFFGFVSSSCSFAALSGARALFAKGAGLVASLAFLLASTNLVVELGIIIAVFLLVLVATALLMHYGFAFAGQLPDADAARAVVDRTFFALDYTAALNAVFVAATGLFVLRARSDGHGHGGLFAEPVLASVTLLALAWLAIGLGLTAFGYGG